MKTMRTLFLLPGFVAPFGTAATGQDADTSKDNPRAAAAKPNSVEQAPLPADKAETGGKAPDNQSVAPVPPTPATTSASGESGLRLNFRGAPLDMVLNYLSDAAGFVINLKPGTDVKGKTVDVWSNQPLNKDEAVDLLNTVLNQNGFAAIRKGRTLTIMTRKEAKTEDIPVNRGCDPDAIPKSDEMVTQIVPVHYANAKQLKKDLKGLLPEGAE